MHIFKKLFKNPMANTFSYIIYKKQKKVKGKKHKKYKKLEGRETSSNPSNKEVVRYAFMWRV